MHYYKGFSTIPTLLIVLGIVVLVGVGYTVINSQTREEANVQPAASNPSEKSPDTEPSMAWRLADTGEKDIEGTPYTTVTAVVNGVTYEAGTFAGSCSEIGASGGIDGKGLLAGELSAVQCWFAGSGNEIGIFAHEDGGFQIMVGELSEGEEGAGIARGNFEIKVDIAP